MGAFLVVRWQWLGGYALQIGSIFDWRDKGLLVKVVDSLRSIHSTNSIISPRLLFRLFVEWWKVQNPRGWFLGGFLLIQSIRVSVVRWDDWCYFLKRLRPMTTIPRRPVPRSSIVAGSGTGAGPVPFS